MKVGFRERNPVPIAIIGIAVIVGLLVVGFNASRLPLINHRTTYHGEFAEAAGLDTNNEVRIAGVRVGMVTDVALAGDKVRVTFEVDSAQHLGDETKLEIKLKTLLGQKYLDVQPDGDGRLAAGATVPLDHTAVPFQVNDAFGQLAENLDAIDVDKLAQALDTLSSTFGDPKGNTGAALRGLGRLSTTIASRDAQLQELLAGTKTVTKALSSRDAELVRLFGDADLILKVVVQRRDLIRALLRDTSALSKELISLVRDDRGQLDPLLDNLHEVAQVLHANIANLDKSAKLLGPFARYNANATGNGRWLDVYGENLLVSDSLLCSVGACP